VANTLAAVEQGARMVQGTINGYGERCGNANLVSILPTLQLKMGVESIPPEKLSELTRLSHFVAETANLRPDEWAPYVGRNAFAHKGGMHVAGMLADKRTFEHVDPEIVGNERTMVASELSGRSTIVAKAEEFGLVVDDPEVVGRILARLKELEHRGYHFEVADASLRLLMERELGIYTPLFTIESYRVISERRADGTVETEATVKLSYDGERVVGTAEGNGPVHALDLALRRALGDRIPELTLIELVNFKVRILDDGHGAASATRVIIDSSNGVESWGAIGVSENVIEASWEALVESIEHGVRRTASARQASSA
jgi:2-isopropylmalate synthase